LKYETLCSQRSLEDIFPCKKLGYKSVWTLEERDVGGASVSDPYAYVLIPKGESLFGLNGILGINITEPLFLF
jgi:hypothetical protein